MKEIEIPFGAFDSELQGFEYTIPDGYTAEIVDGKVIVKKEESEDERMRRKFIKALKECCLTYFDDEFTVQEAIDWLEKQAEQPNKVSIWKHLNKGIGIVGIGDGVPTYLIKNGTTYSLSSCLSSECDYIELSELDKLMVEKQGEWRPQPKQELVNIKQNEIQMTMGTIKSYTDLEQSNKLAEILPLESADMCYPLPCEGGDKPLLEQGGFGSTPCWSLAALLEILQKSAYYIDEDANVVLYSYKAVEWDLEINNSDLRLIAEPNPIDACYEMILKLHELNLL